MARGKVKIRMRVLWMLGILCALIAACTLPAWADRIELKDGTVIENCFVRDEGTHFLVWEKMEDVGTTKIRVVPRSLAKEPIQQSRDASWDVHPSLPDLTVTFIEMNPKLAGLHWQIKYDELGTPVIGGQKILVDQGDEGNRMRPEETVKNVKLKYKPGEVVTLTAHVKNVGFVDAKPFEYAWLIDGKQVSKGKHTKPVKELEELVFPYKYKWIEGQHTVTFKITTVQPEISVLNNEATDALYGWGFAFVINKNRTYHQQRSAFGTFCFEDYYRWHVELMNTLFKATVFPSCPDGIQARVRLDRIIYCDDPNTQSMPLCTAPDGLGYLNGMWTWTDSEEEKKNGWLAGDYYRWGTEWSLPHELGHQLGIPDWYCQDNYGVKDHLWADNGDMVCHLMDHPMTMMHWHGPYLYTEVDAGYFNQSWDKPRGYFGDYMFAIPDENFLRVVDVNGLPVPDAKVEVFQRGVTPDPNGAPTEQQGANYFPVTETGQQSNDQSKHPVIVGTTDKDGIMRLPNRPAKEVITLNGFHRKANPFGNIDCVGARCQLLAKVTKFDNPCYYFMDAFNFNEAWFRGDKDKHTFVLKTPYRSVSSPLAPVNVKFEQVDATHARVTWDAPKMIREQQYLDRVIGYKVYRRVGVMGLSDRPWFVVATLNPDARECLVDLKQQPMDNGYYAQTERYAVSSLGETSIESELVQAPLPQAQQ